MTLTEFLTARLDEREAAAKAATAGPWTMRRGLGSWGDDLIEPHSRGLDDSVVTQDAAVAECGPLDSAHIALNDPAYVLADVEAKRKILDSYQRSEAALPASGWESDGTQELEWVVRMLASVWSGHPDYDEAWRP